MYQTPPLNIQVSPSNDQVKTAQQTGSGKDSDPKYQIPQRSPAPQPPSSTQLDERYLHHLQKEEVPSQFLEQTPHDELVNASTEEESYERSCVLVDFH